MKYFWDGFEKKAAARSEILAQALTFPLAPLHLVGNLTGVAMGPYTDEEQKEVNKRIFSNLIPTVGAYRLGRRAAGLGLTKDEREKPNE